MLCQNRPDGGLGPYTTIAGTHVLTSCFDDVILEPLGSWVFILGTAILFVIFWGRRSRETNYQEQAEMLPLETKSSTKAVAQLEKTRLLWGGKWPKFRRFLLVLTAVLMVANFAMHCLEIARLSANHQGVGLLPFCLVSLLIVFISLWVPSPAWSAGGFNKPARPHGMAFFGLVNFWAVWMVITNGIKLWTFTSVYNVIGQQAYDGPDSKYPESDRVIDTVVILAVYAVIWLGYLHEVYLEYLRYDWKWFW